MTASPQATTVTFAPETPVEYHGSMTDYHGPAVVVCRCHCRSCPWLERGELGNGDPRWELQTWDGRTLLHVRAASVTPLVHVGEVAR